MIFAAARGPAAGGEEDLRCYPWGDRWDASRCVCGERRSTSTEEVSQNPEGDSPYKVSDLVGNVREWLHDFHPQEPMLSACKGGGFDATCEIWGLIHFTIWAESTIRDADLGFRIVSTRDPSELSLMKHVVV